LESRERFAQILRDDGDRVELLVAAFLFELSLIGRGFYIEGGVSEHEGYRALRQVNEIIHRVAHARSFQGDFCRVLDEFAAMGRFRLDAAFEAALSSLDGAGRSERDDD
jgi:hypothetical protein